MILTLFQTVLLYFIGLFKLLCVVQLLRVGKATHMGPEQRLVAEWYRPIVAQIKNEKFYININQVCYIVYSLAFIHVFEGYQNFIHFLMFFNRKLLIEPYTDPAL